AVSAAVPGRDGGRATAAGRVHDRDDHHAGHCADPLTPSCRPPPAARERSTTALKHRLAVARRSSAVTSYGRRTRTPTKPHAEVERTRAYLGEPHAGIPPTRCSGTRTLDQPTVRRCTPAAPTVDEAPVAAGRPRRPPAGPR